MDLKNLVSPDSNWNKLETRGIPPDSQVSIGFAITVSSEQEENRISALLLSKLNDLRIKTRIDTSQKLFKRTRKYVLIGELPVGRWKDLSETDYYSSIGHLFNFCSENYCDFGTFGVEIG
jgi:hypothetical protein